MFNPGPNGCLADTPQKQIQPAVSPESTQLPVFFSHKLIRFFGQVNPLLAGCSLRMPSKEGWCYHVSKAEMPWQAAR